MVDLGERECSNVCKMTCDFILHQAQSYQNMDQWNEEKDIAVTETN